MTDFAAPNERDPEIHEAFLSLACANPLLRKAPAILKDLLRLRPSGLGWFGWFHGLKNSFEFYRRARASISFAIRPERFCTSGRPSRCGLGCGRTSSSRPTLGRRFGSCLS